MDANPGITLDQVAGKITDATKGLATSTGVTNAISDALKGYATAKDIQTAIAGIKFPEGLSKVDVTQAITDYMKANPGLSLADVSSNIVNATKNLATNAGVTTAIGDALKGYATNKDIQSAIAGIKFPVGISKDDVSSAIKTYMEANPGLSLADVASKVADATKGLHAHQGRTSSAMPGCHMYRTYRWLLDSHQLAVYDLEARQLSAGVAGAAGSGQST
jgi:phage tail protein X